MGMFCFSVESQNDNANVLKRRDYNPSDLKNINVLISGENHFGDTGFVRNMIKRFKPKYYLTEHIMYDVLSNREEIENRVNAVGSDDFLYNMFTKKYLEAVKDLDVIVVGCDYKPIEKGKAGHREFEHVVYDEEINESFKKRESRMLSVIKQYAAKGRVFASIGDDHLRVQKDDFYTRASPITNHFKGDNTALILRLDKGATK